MNLFQLRNFQGCLQQSIRNLTFCQTTFVVRTNYTSDECICFQLPRLFVTNVKPSISMGNTLETNTHQDATELHLHLHINQRNPRNCWQQLTGPHLGCNLCTQPKHLGSSESLNDHISNFQVPTSKAIYFG